MSNQNIIKRLGNNIMSYTYDGDQQSFYVNGRCFYGDRYGALNYLKRLHTKSLRVRS